MRKTCVTPVAILLLMLLGDATAHADGGIQLPSDPDIAVSIGSGTFFGTSSRYEFARIQPTFLELELTLFNRGRACRWLCRLNVNGTINPETNRLGYRDELETVEMKDADGNDVTAHKSGVVSARVGTGIMWAASTGLQLSILDVSHLHIDVFGEYSASLQTKRANVENLDVHALLTREVNGEKVYGGEIDLDATHLAQEYGTVAFNWRMMHAGITLAFPLKPKRLNSQPFTPFLRLGGVWFDSKISLKVDQKLLDDLAQFGVKPDDIPSGKQVTKVSPTATIGARLEINRNNALEFNGTFIHASGVTAYLMVGSYSVRFDYGDIASLFRRKR